MPLTIAPLEREDISTFVRIELEAFRSHPRMPMLWPRGYTDDLYAFYESTKNSDFDNPDCRFMKAVDSETGQMIAGSEWTFSLDVEKQKGKERVDADGGPPENWPTDGNWEMRRFYNLNLEKWMDEHLVGKPYIKLEFLVTHPDFQGKGAGTKLLAWGVNEADRLGVRMALEGTPTGVPLYKRFGFEETEVIKADMRQFGWDKPYDPEAAKRVWMIREPYSKKPLAA